MIDLIKQYNKYREKYNKNYRKYGLMQMSELTFTDYKTEYIRRKNDLQVAGKRADSSKINTSIVNAQTYEYSRAQARARQTMLNKALGRKVRQIDIMLGKELTDEDWEKYKKLRDVEKAKWLEQYGDLTGFDDFMREEYWGSE